MRWLAVVLAAMSSLPAHAQLTAPVRNGDTTITVIGTRPRGEARAELSDWRMAETPHVVVFGRGDEAELRRTAHNLEKLHFLLTALLGRADQRDDTIKVAVTMIEDAAGFEQLRLTDLRWQYGPFPAVFAKTIYYDPRAEGSVIATTETDLNLVLRPSTGRPTSRDCDPDDDNPLWANYNVAHANPEGLSKGRVEQDPVEMLAQLSVNEITVCQSAQSRLYAAFAQNYLMTYFPAAYPRWFLQGFGEMFGTMVAGNGTVDYGQRPAGFFKVIDRFGDYPVRDVLNGRYLTGKGRAWTPYHAWRLVHFLYFSDDWKPRLQRYLAEVAKGADPERAAAILGDPGALQRAVTIHRGSKAPFDRLTFPTERTPEPTVRRLTRAEAGLIRGRLELGARVDLPETDRAAALARRTAWLDRLRANATRFPDLIENQLLLAEAECRSGHADECAAAADRALAKAPSDIGALVWKGTAMVQQAARAPAADRAARLAEARRWLVRANKLDPDAILPLIAYHDSFAMGGEPATDAAVGGLYKVVQSAPAAPAPRVTLGKDLVARDLDADAAATLLPVARGAFDTPERHAAAALLSKVGVPR